MYGMWIFVILHVQENKESLFLPHYKQSGGSLALPVNISRGGNVITIYLINYSIHKNSCDFFDAEKTIRRFILAVKNKFVPQGKVKVQETIDAVNYQPSGEENIKQESRRTWLTDVHMCVYFNSFVQRELSKNFMKRVIVSGLKGSSWQFKRFERLSVIATAVDTNLSLA